MSENIFSIRLKEFRASLGLNQKEFAAELNIRQSTLSGYENGTITPSADILLMIANKYNISLDWLFGVSQNRSSISSLTNVVDFILQINDLNELRYELEINEHLSNDTETESEKWYASMKFFGNDPIHETNGPFCQFLAALRENRENLETYFTDRESYDFWKKNMLERYEKYPLSQKKYEELDFNERIRRRDHLLNTKYGNKSE